MYSIGKLASTSGLSRSTLLYYESIGLLKASGRTETKYRIYIEEDKKRLEQICLYRQMGIPLKEIKSILDISGGRLTDILEIHLKRLSGKIRSLRRQQHAILGILKTKDIHKQAGLINKEAWVALLKSTGLTEEETNKWHIEFEKLSPEGHHDFLVSLGINEDEIASIREWSAGGAEK